MLIHWCKTELARKKKKKRVIRKDGLLEKERVTGAYENEEFFKLRNKIIGECVSAYSLRLPTENWTCQQQRMCWPHRIYQRYSHFV